MSFLILGEVASITQMLSEDAIDLIEQSKEESKEKEGSEKSMDDIEKISYDEFNNSISGFTSDLMLNNLTNNHVLLSQFEHDILVPPPEYI